MKNINCFLASDQTEDELRLELDQVSFHGFNLFFIIIGHVTLTFRQRAVLQFCTGSFFAFSQVARKLS